MKKRVIAVLTAVLMTASLAGCGSGKLSNDYVTVNKYKGLEVTEVAKNEVSDDSVEQEIQSRLEAAATEQDVTDRSAQSGDWVNIDYTGTLDGVAFDGGTATGYDLELGSGSFIGASGDYQGFEDQIVGHNTGEEFDITVQFPENYQSSDLAGKPANFHIVLNKIYQKVTPELTDEWVANNSESSKTVDEYKEEVLPKAVRRRVAIEALSDFGWGRYVGLDGAYVTMHGFGASAPAAQLFEHFGFTVDHVVETVEKLF